MAAGIIHCHVDREGPRVTLALRSDCGRFRASIVMHHRGAAALGVNLRDAADADGDVEREFALRAELVAEKEKEAA